MTFNFLSAPAAKRIRDIWWKKREPTKKSFRRYESFNLRGLASRGFMGTGRQLNPPETGANDREAESGTVGQTGDREKVTITVSR